MAKYYPTDEQMLGLYRFLKVLKLGNVKWRKIELSGDTIFIKAEPVKGEIDIRIFKVFENGEVDDDGFREC